MTKFCPEDGQLLIEIERADRYDTDTGHPMKNRYLICPENAEAVSRLGIAWSHHAYYWSNGYFGGRFGRGWKYIDPLDRR